MPFMTANWIFGFACAWTFFLLGRHEARTSDRRDFGALWALASILVTVVAIQGLGAGWFMVVVCQALLYLAITVARVVFED
jgi:hypothetical protein